MSLGTVLQVSGLAKHFGGVRALDGVDFEVPAGQCVALIGPNGAGKSTCFACLAGQQVPTTGEVLWQGQSLLGKPPAERQRLGVARTFQVAQTFEALTVLQNIQLVLRGAAPLAWWDRLDSRQPGVRLFVLGRRGESARSTQRDLGRNVERVVRALDRPILTVTEGFKAPGRVLIAFDGSSITRRGVEMVAASPLFKGLPVYLLMSGKASQEGPKQMAWATEKLESAGFGVVGEIVPGDPEATIAQAIQSKGIDLLVMGAYTHSPLRSLFLGSKTDDLLRSARIPTLLLR